VDSSVPGVVPCGITEPALFILDWSAHRYKGDFREFVETLVAALRQFEES